MVKIYFIFICFIASLSFKVSSKDSCYLSPMILMTNLEMNFKEFDQTQNNGWRTLANNGCYFESAILINSYHLKHMPKLKKWQNRVLYWHAGQMYAFNNDYLLAKSKFAKSIKKDELPDDAFKWNAYVNGSISFLEGKLSELKKYQNELKTATNPHSKVNLAVLKRMVQCFGQSYKKVYSNACIPNN